MKKHEIASKMVAYGHTFSDQRTLDAYKKMQSEKRQRLAERKKSLTPAEQENANIRKHFASETKHFKI